MKIKLLQKDGKACFVSLCPNCGRALPIFRADIIFGIKYCMCLNKGRLNEIKLEEE